MTFKAGDVWEWGGNQGIYLLLQQSPCEFGTTRVREQETWTTFRLDTGERVQAILHAETFEDGIHWRKL